MIEVVEGKGVGSGKSYYVASRILHHLGQGGTVALSYKFLMNWDGVVAWVRKNYRREPVPEQIITIGPEDTKRIHEVTPGGTSDHQVLLVCDESQDDFDARGFMDDDRTEKLQKRAFFRWLCQCRHDDTDVIFITQHKENIDVKIRRLVTYVIRVRNMTTFAIGGMVTPWWKYFFLRKLDQDGKTEITTQWLPWDKMIFAAYVSKSQKGAHKRSGIVGRRQLESVVKKQSKMFRFCLIILPCLLVVMVLAAFKFKRDGLGVDKLVQKPQASSVPQTVAFRVGDREAKPRVIQRVETFRSSDFATYLRTDVGEYTVGEMCGDGMVDMIKNRTVAIHPLGERYRDTLWIVAVDARVGGAVPLSSSPVAPSQAGVGPQVVPGAPNPLPVSNGSRLGVSPEVRGWYGSGDPLDHAQMAADEAEIDNYLHTPLSGLGVGPAARR